MRGSTLYPLNRLAELDEELYVTELSKYSDHPSRRGLPGRRVPKLECAWGDALHFSPVHPRLIHAAWSELGGNGAPPARWFALPLGRLDVDRTVVYKGSGRNPSAAIPEAEIERLDPEAYEEPRRVPDATLNWYRELVAGGRSGAWFVGVPHVLVAEAVEVGGCEVITVGRQASGARLQASG